MDMKLGVFENLT